ncbi:MAG: alpha/beta hydrolase [Pseudomonadales bacterium]|jgi:pimeloyl-ACP methyl ester carboxylesterase|tara:strand:+ start:3104 stop:4021 length:918 start_codon:yes stop_codon:yes gene_type:complete
MPHAIRLGEETEFEIFGRKMTAKLWGNPAGYPTLAIHGWLDNAGTFDRLAPLLSELNIIALDLAGHGKSDHRAPGVQYHHGDYVLDIMSLVETLGWSTFNLIGHSMGGQISSVIAATFPDRVNQAFMIDGFAAEGTYSDEERVAGNRQAIEKMITGHTRPAKVFEDTQSMALRVTQATDQTLDAASVLVSRGHKIVDGGVSWRTDPRIRYPSSNRFTRNQLNIMLQQSTSPALLIVAEQGDRWYQGEVPVSEIHHPNLTVVRLDGPHHIHLEADYVNQVADLARAFFELDKADDRTVEHEQVLSA